VQGSTAMKAFVANALAAAVIAGTTPILAAPVDAQRVAQTVRAELKRLQVPSASVAIVLDGRVAYAQAFGMAQLDPGRTATTATRYEIGSISKQFLALAFVSLQEQRQLTLDDKVGKYLPGAGPTTDVTLRQLLSHTGGIRDFWPQDYVFTRMLSPISHQELLDTWAWKPLDFPPGERYQYSNTGYVVAGVIFEKVEGESLFAFLQRRVFGPLKMSSVLDVDGANMQPSDAVGYTRAALGPLRERVRVGRGWMFAAGELAMTAEDLARWDISIIDRSLMQPASYNELEREIVLDNGVGARYALGLGVRMQSERRVLAHGGATSGFISYNVIYPDQRAAIVVLTNSDAADAASDIADKLRDLVFESVSPIDETRRQEARRIYDGLREGKLDRSLLTDNANAYFTPENVADVARGIAPLGPVKSFKLVANGTRGGMDFRVYEISLAKRQLELVTRSLPNGKLEQYMIAAK